MELKKFEIEISTTKYVTIEAVDQLDARARAMEMPLTLEDFDWDFSVDEE